MNPKTRLFVAFVALALPPACDTLGAGSDDASVGGTQTAREMGVGGGAGATGGSGSAVDATAGQGGAGGAGGTPTDSRPSAIDAGPGDATHLPPSDATNPPDIDAATPPREDAASPPRPDAAGSLPPDAAPPPDAFIPMGTPACAALGGYCDHWQTPCREGYTGHSPEDCPLGRSGQCCVPLPADCLPAGGQSAGAPDCCPGLLAVACTGPDAAGECIECDGGFTCILAGDLACGAGENLCNSPLDCGPPVECRVPLDCIGQRWNIRCLGHWSCDAGQCVESCGGSCGDGECRVEDGEAHDTCSPECR